MIDYLKKQEEFKAKKKIIFFSDGAPTQFKNKKNFYNLCQFKKDFVMDAEWHFFATSHGKSPCDAMGGTFKRNAKIHNMQMPFNGLKNAAELFKWAEDNAKEGRSEVHYIWCSDLEYKQKCIYMNSRFTLNLRTIHETRDLHSFMPIDENTISAKQFSFSSDAHPHTLL